VGQSVELRYDPFDLTRLEVRYYDAFLELAQPEQIRRTVYTDVTPDPQPHAPPPRTGEGTIFSAGFVAGAHEFTKGLARKINNLCLNALLIGCTEQQRVLDETVLKRTILELGDSI